MTDIKLISQARRCRVLQLSQHPGGCADFLSFILYSVSPLYLTWNTLESMVLKWKAVFQAIDPSYLLIK